MISNNIDIIHKIYNDINLNEGSILKLDRMWKEPWRFYHTIEHLHDLIFKI